MSLLDRPAAAITATWRSAAVSRVRSRTACRAGVTGCSQEPASVLARSSALAVRLRAPARPPGRRGMGGRLGREEPGAETLERRGRLLQALGIAGGQRPAVQGPC